MNMIIGMDIGGTSIKLGAWVDNACTAWQAGIPVPQSKDPGIIGDVLAAAITDFVAALPMVPSALGIGSCGLIAGGTIFQSPNTPWDKLPLVEVMQDRVSYPVFVLNDADAFLMGGLETLLERRCIAIGITLGTGIGTALWFTDRLFSGGAGISPEGGHITLGIDRVCSNTGIPGSWEHMAGRDALLRYYDEAGGSGGSDPEGVAKAAHAGEAAAITAWNRYGRYVGAGLGSLCNVLSPDYVLIGGGMANANELFADSMHAGLERHLLAAMPRPDIHFLDHRDDIVAHGAALHAATKLGHQ